MIKHAGGHYLYIEIDNSGEDVQICLHNDGEIPKQKIEEKGGLRNQDDGRINRWRVSH